MNAQRGLNLFFNVLLACSRLREGGERRQSGREKKKKKKRDLKLRRRAGGARLRRFFSWAFRISPFPA